MENTPEKKKCLRVWRGGGGGGRFHSFNTRVFRPDSNEQLSADIYYSCLCFVLFFLSFFLLHNSGSQLCLRCLVSVFFFLFLCFLFLCFCSFTYFVLEGALGLR